MDKINKITNSLPLLSNEQLEIIDKLISSWNVSTNISLEATNMLDNYSNEELLDEYGILFYKNSKENFDGISLDYNIQDSTPKTSLENISSKSINDLNSFDISALISNKPGVEKKSTPTQDIKPSTEKKDINNLSTIDISSLISKKTSVAPRSSEVDVEDFDPLFPNEDFDSMTNLDDSKYKDLDFSSLISKKN